jgi:hypothetical protein
MRLTVSTRVMGALRRTDNVRAGGRRGRESENGCESEVCFASRTSACCKEVVDDTNKTQ